MKHLLILSCLTFMIGASYCKRHSAGSQPSVIGSYELSAYDNAGRPAFTGKIALTSLNQNHVEGQCTVVRGKNAPETLRDESGDCGGLIEGKTISLDSAPSLDDAGLLFEGEFNDGRITGVWRIDGFATSPPLGKFEAVQKK